MTRSYIQPTVAVAGGGLAGLAAACALADSGFRVNLFERRPYLGGRASSYEDPREKRGLGAVDVIAIVVVIVLLGTALGALVVNRSMRAYPGDSWAGRLAESVAEEAPPTSPTAR